MRAGFQDFRTVPVLHPRGKPVLRQARQSVPSNSIQGLIGGYTADSYDRVMKNATNRWANRKAIGFCTLALFPAVAAAFGPRIPRAKNAEPASLAVVGGSLLCFGLYRRKNP